MARTAKLTKTNTAKPRKKSPRASTAPKSAPKAKVKLIAAPKKPKSVQPATAPKLSVGELQALLEKLQSANAVLRAKNREAGRAVKAATAKIAELEGEVARIGKSSAPKVGAAKSVASKAVRQNRRGRASKFSEAVSQGIGSGEPAAGDEEPTGN